MSKYQPLSDHLAGRAEPEWRASFPEIEKVLGFPLPKTARTGAGWWANNGERPQVRAWTSAGWEVAEVNPAGEEVVFRRPVSEAALQNPLVDDDLGPEVATQGSGQVQALKTKLESLPARPRGWGLAAAITAGVAVAAGVGTLVVRGLMKRGRTPNS